MEATEEDIKMPGGGSLMEGLPQYRHPFGDKKFVHKKFKAVSTRVFKLNYCQTLFECSEDANCKIASYIHVPFESTYYSSA
jgi:hypothetical protein